MGVRTAKKAWGARGFAFGGRRGAELSVGYVPSTELCVWQRGRSENAAVEEREAS